MVKSTHVKISTAKICEGNKQRAHALTFFVRISLRKTCQSKKKYYDTRQNRIIESEIMNDVFL
mgnify:FL=1